MRCPLWRADICARFTKGFNTADLKAAKVMLEELA